jgi:hypothetical protein
MPLSVPQATIANDSRRFRTAICGRRFGKSHLAMRELSRFAATPDSLVLYCAPSYRMAKNILWRPLKKKLLSLNWVAKINESELSIELVNGSIIQLRGTENYDSLRGTGNTFIVLDEAADMNPEVWYEVLRPTLSDTGGSALFLGTPKGMNWLKDIYDMARVEPEAWASFQYSTLEGGNVPAAEVESARRDLDEKTFRQEYMATFESYAGLIYYGFGEHNIGPTPDIEAKDTLLVGLDFNVQPLCAVVATRKDNHLYVHDEICIDGASTHDLIEEVGRRWPGHRVEVMPDASGAQRRTSSTTTDHIILRNAQWRVNVGRINPAVVDRIAAVNSRLKSTNGQVHVTINKNCKRLIKGLTAQVYKEGTRLPEKGGTNDLSHLNDAFGYLINWYWPIKRDVDTSAQPQSWSHF